MPLETVQAPSEKETPAPTPSLKEHTPAPEFDWKALEGKSPEEFRQAVLGDKPAAPASPEAKEVKPAEVAKPSEEAAPPLEDQLAKIEAETPEESKEPKLDAEQQAVLSLFPNRQAAEQAANLIQSYSHFTNTFVGRDFKAVEQMFQEFDPEAYSAFMDHLYLANIDTWVDRWIDEKEGTTSPRVKQMETRLNAMERAAQERNQHEVRQRQQESQARLSREFQSHLDKLFDAIQFSEHDRPWVSDRIRTKLANKPEAAQLVRSGKFGPVNKVFTETIREFVARDKDTSAARQSQLQAQAAHKPPLASTPAILPSDLPDDVRQVQRGQEDSWMDHQLSKLFASKRK